MWLVTNVFLDDDEGALYAPREKREAQKKQKSIINKVGTLINLLITIL